jgi:formyltetrahydrofolate-dependent phosphoribosylglycinamide formyltransferase
VAVTARLVVLASGSGSNLQALIDGVVAGRLDAEIVAVYVNRRGAYARTRAREAGITEEFVPMKPFLEANGDGRSGREAYDRALADRIATHEPAAIVCAGWMHLFTNVFLDRFSGKVINLHPALPGMFPGAHAIDDAWAAHESRGLDHTGVMVHLVPDEGVDNGPVLRSRRVPIRADDSREVFEARIHAVEHELLLAAVADLVGAS